MEKAFNEGQKIESFLCKKWRLVLMESDGRIISVSASEASYLNFKSDRTYSDSSARFGVSIGSWTFSRNDSVLETMDKGGKSNVKIVSITSTELKTEIVYPNAVMLLTYKKDE